ncbi:UDP-glucose 6-dehydrogenase [Podospora conica]|nr:UDP-glucose 6-dehydrogenase [Schizothecium conicum]
MSTLAHPAVRKVCFIGAGYVGGPTAAVIALNNKDVSVTVVDKDVARIARWNSQHPPIHEPGLQEILRITRDGTNTYQFNQNRRGTPAAGICHVNMGRLPNLFFTTDMEDSIRTADIVFICVNTPTKGEHKGDGSGMEFDKSGMELDMTSFDNVGAVVAAYARPGVIIVEKSTVPCGTADAYERVVRLSLPNLFFDVLSNPEFLAAGTAIHDLLYPNRVLIGSAKTGAGQRAAQILASLYHWVPKDRIITTDYFSSELTKVAANCMLAQRVSSINSFAAICDAKGADIDEVARALGADDRIGPEYLRAGMGFGGSCFKKDVLSLVHLANVLKLKPVADYWLAVLEMNNFAKDRVFTRLIESLDKVWGKKITVLGYAFKHNTNDTRESPVHTLINGIVDQKPVEIAIFDSNCPVEHIEKEVDSIHGQGMATKSGRVSVYRDAQSACKGAHAIVLTTEFRDFEYEVSSTAAWTSGATQRSDPRPFRGPWPTEAELLALHYFLQQCPDAPSPARKENNKPMPGKAPLLTRDDPLGQFKPMPPCQRDCPECSGRDAKKSAASDNLGNAAGKNSGNAASNNSGNAAGNNLGNAASARKLNWREVKANMEEPYLVLDGRGVLDIATMEKMGFKVLSVGRQSRAEWHKRLEPGHSAS